MKLFADQLLIAVKPIHMLIGEGQNSQFVAMASGISTNKSNFMYQWKKKDSDSFSNKVSSISGAKLVIPNVDESDEGQYYCVVTNEWGRSVRSNDVTLIVQGTYTL